MTEPQARPPDDLDRLEFMLILGALPVVAAPTLSTALSLTIVLLAMTFITTHVMTYCRTWLAPAQGLTAALILNAASITLFSLILHAFWPRLHQALGIYLPALAALGLPIYLTQMRLAAPGFLPVPDSHDLRRYAVLIVFLGFLRELLAHGGWLLDMGLNLRLPGYGGLPFWAMPMGGLLAAGLILALLRHLDLSHRLPGSQASSSEIEHE
jgi:Na+-transporting NADH:ubiquinone oxidoreductase subunit NqrD